MARVRERIRAYDTAVEAIAGRYGCFLVDYWDVAAMDDDVYWDEDRLHLSPGGSPAGGAQRAGGPRPGGRLLAHAGRPEPAPARSARGWRATGAG